MKKPPHPKTESPVGVIIGSGDSKLSVDWKKFSTDGASAIANGLASYLGLFDGTSNAITSLFSAASAIKYDISVEQRAWELFCLSFAWAFDDIRMTDGDNSPDLVQSFRRALDNARDVISITPQVIPPEFLTVPSSLPLYARVRDVFISAKSDYRPGDRESDDLLRQRFDAAFNRAVYEIWSRNPEIFGPIELALKAPGATASALNFQWNSYHGSLAYDFDVKPVFGQEKLKIPLAQIYVPLRAVTLEYHQPNMERSGKDQFQRAGLVSSKAKKRWVVIELDHELDEWTQRWGHDDWLLLIGVGPGSGKSTTVKALAKRLAATGRVRVLSVPLQYIDISKDLGEEINNFFIGRVGSPFRQPPLARDAVEQGHPMVLIFDGLDELARPGEAANEVTRQFVTKLTQLVATLKGDGRGLVKAVVTGRMPSFQAAKSYASNSERRNYEVIGYTSNIDLPKSEMSQQERSLFEKDQRPIWWQRYAQSAGLHEQLPTAMKDSALEDITREPLLCYLLALSGYAVDNWEEAARNRNLIYEKLLFEVWQRGWGEGGRQGQSKSLGLANFNILMQTFALAAWRGGDTRVASERNFLESIKVMNADEAWQQFISDSGADITNLAMNFYLKGNDLERRGFEFTHKSFGDYLTARALLSIAQGVVDLGSRRIDAACAEWMHATAHGMVTWEVATFLRDEIRLQLQREGDVKVKLMRDYFVTLASIAMNEGLPAHTIQANTWRMREAFHNNAELAIWAILNASTLAVGQKSGVDARFKVTSDNRDALAKLLDRHRMRTRPIPTQGRRGDPVHSNDDGNDHNLVSTINDSGTFSISDCLAFIDAEGANLFEAYLEKADLSYANFRFSNLSGAHLCEAVVRGTNFTETKFERAHLDGIDFREAVIDECYFYDARIGRAKFSTQQVSNLSLSLTSLISEDVSIKPQELHSIKDHNIDMSGSNRSHLFEVLTSKIRRILNR